MNFDKLAKAFGPSLLKFAGKINGKVESVAERVDLIENESIKLVGGISFSEVILHLAIALALLSLGVQLWDSSVEQSAIAFVSAILLVRSHIKMTAMMAFSVLTTSLYGKALLRAYIVRQIICEAVEESAKNNGKTVDGNAVYDVADRTAVDLIVSARYNKNSNGDNDD